MPTTVPEVISRLHEIEAAASAKDGVGCFARLYREVTEDVDATLASQSFADAPFMQSLDVCFAGLFLMALAAFESDPTKAPSAWRPLFERRSERGIAPLQFALAGMNAHINRDLPVALVTTCGSLHVDLAERTPQHGDFERVNLLLAQVETRIKRLYVTGWLATLDRLVHRIHRIDDVAAMWDIARARDAAWTNAQALWSLRDDPPVAADFVASLDRMVGLAGRGLLLPADTMLGKVARLFG